MSKPLKILLQTTIPFVEDDWHIGRFSNLAVRLGELPGVEITARDRAAPPGTDDPVLATLDSSDFDELWLFAVDTGDGLTRDECKAISRFRQRGGGIMLTRDHMDLGSSICLLGGVGAAHYFHSRNTDPDESRHCRDDQETRSIDWPNYHSGANGDFQVLSTVGEPHSVLAGVRHLPAHPHEGAVGAPADDASARVIAIGMSQASGRPFNLAVAFERGRDGGRAIAQSTFHHFADFNLDPSRGAPSFVTEPPGDGFAREPAALAETYRYFENLARWLAP
jgi:hypothetical protein